MSVRTIRYQAMNGKWYTLEIADIIDPLDVKDDSQEAEKEVQMNVREEMLQQLDTEERIRQETCHAEFLQWSGWDDAMPLCDQLHDTSNTFIVGRKGNLVCFYARQGESTVHLPCEVQTAKLIIRALSEFVADIEKSPKKDD